jgi:hypothetical protein
MNSRFQELAEQAGMYVDLNGSPWPKWMGAEECEVAYAKFAELIVREMLDIFDKRAEPGTGFYEPHEPAELIKQHFGVEE